MRAFIARAHSEVFATPDSRGLIGWKNRRSRFMGAFGARIEIYSGECVYFANL